MEFNPTNAQIAAAIRAQGLDGARRPDRRILPHEESAMRAALQAAAQVGPGLELAKPLCWVNEDELPDSLSIVAYSKLFPYSKVEGVRMFPIFGPNLKDDSNLLQEAVNRIKDMLAEDEGQAWKEARKFVGKVEKGTVKTWEDEENEARCEPNEWPKMPADYDGDGSVAAMARAAEKEQPAPAPVPDERDPLRQALAALVRDADSEPDDEYLQGAGKNRVAVHRKGIERARAALAAAPAQEHAQPAAPALEAVAAIEKAVDAIESKINEPREPGWSYRNTITTNRNIVREQCAVIRAALAAAPQAPAPAPWASQLEQAAKKLAVLHSSYTQLAFAQADDRIKNVALDRYHAAQAEFDALIASAAPVLKRAPKPVATLNVLENGCLEYETCEAGWLLPEGLHRLYSAPAAPAVDVPAPEDAKRLDYLQQQGATVERVAEGRPWVWRFRIGGLHCTDKEDIRAAIDAAIAAWAAIKGGS